MDIAGSYTTIDGPAGNLGTYVTGINNLGQIAGFYWTSFGTWGYVYAGGNLVTTDPTGSYIPTAINDAGQIVGHYDGQNSAPGAPPPVVTPGGGGSFIAVANNLTVSSGGAVELGAPYAGEVSFAGSTGTFKLDASNLFAGMVVGMTGNDAIDFADINFAALPQVTFSGSSVGGLMSITDGTHTSNVTLKGDYQSAFWVLWNDGAGGTSVLDPSIGAPQVQVAAGTIVDIPAAYAGSAVFSGSTGTLRLENSSSFTGTVAGMAANDILDLADINFATLQAPSFHNATASGGTLTVTDGSHTANIALLGNYLASTFVAASDGHGGTSVIDPPAANQNNPLAQAQHA
jgi:hypothetical protein